MAGDWIKMRNNLWTDPRVAMMCDLTGCAERMVIRGLFWLWTTADQRTEDRHMPSLAVAAIDDKCCVAGLGDALLAVGLVELVAMIPAARGIRAASRSATSMDTTARRPRNPWQRPSVCRTTGKSRLM